VRAHIAAFALLLGACHGSTRGADSGADAGMMVEDSGVTVAEPAAPASPARPALPILTPCPAGWATLTGTTSDGRSYTACHPYPAGGPSTCAMDEAHFVGEPGCTKVGAACPLGEWADGLPMAGASLDVFYVRAGGASGGNGSQSTPFGSIAEAIAHVNKPTVLALGKGTHTGAVDLVAHVTLWGACAGQTEVTASASQSGVVTSGAANAAIKNLTITGQHAGVWASGGSIDVEGVIIRSTPDAGLFAMGGAITGRDILIDGIVTGTLGPGGVGALAIGGSRLSLSRVVIRGVVGFGAFAQDPGSAMSLTDVAIVDLQSTPGTLALGRAVHAVGSASVSISRLYVAHAKESGVNSAEMGSSISISDAVIEKLDGFGSNSGSAIQLGQGGAATVRRVLVDSSLHTALSVQDPGTRLSLSDVIVKNTLPDPTNGTFGRALALMSGCRVDASRVVFQKNRYAAVYADGMGTSLSLDDATIEDTDSRASDGLLGIGVAVVNAATASITRARVVNSRGAGVRVDGASTALTATDLEVCLSSGQASDGTLGMGLIVDDGASGDVTRAEIAETTLAGVFVQHHSALHLRDVSIHDTQPSALVNGQSWGLGLIIVGGSMLTLERASVSASRFAGMAISGMSTTATISDLSIADTTGESLAERFGFGLYAEVGASLGLSRALIAHNRSAGVFINSGARARMYDVTICGSMGADSDGSDGYGLEVQGGADVELQRALIDQNRGFGVLALGMGSDVRMHGFSVTRTMATEDRAPVHIGGCGLAATQSGHATGDSFVIEKNALCGVMVVDATMDLTHGRVSGSPIGANVEAMGFDVNRLSTGVSFVGNDTNLDSSVLSVPKSAAPAQLLDIP
jgi:hypothetical protein